ncbi:MAG TPA: hydrogenase 4 subunit B, partial [Longimicrobiales bacterium]|nr:hydrogenase 4 subunit B [Longimicrobiales bacterium]
VLAVPLARARAGSAAVYGTSLALASAGVVLSGSFLLGGAPVERMTLPLGIPWLGAHFRLDALGAFFLVVVHLGAAAASLYALGYGRHEREPARVLPFFAPFVAGMSLVVLADDAFVFLFSWELMSLLSWALVLTHHQERANARAGYVYLVMASFGTLCLLLAFGVLAGSDGAFSFDSIRAASLDGALPALALTLTILGAGSKAGVAPLHVWLPLAHPAAPSHVSALMSGVMTKVALYGFVRIVFDLMGPPEWWWAMVVLSIGAVTAALGVLHAVVQKDLKQLLAYSTVENVGVVMIGLGLALAFDADGLQTASALALGAALFHVLNHSLFKSLLFFGAGAVLSATGERDMEKLGGLVHGMPKTAFGFLVGAAAISALPPLNGFASEWLTFQAILESPRLSSWTLRFLVPGVGALLAMSAALAAACFVKAMGITFLGRPRSEAARDAREVDGWSVVAMSVLAVACVMAGLFPGLVLGALAPVVRLLLGSGTPVQVELPFLTIVPIAQGRSSYSALLLFLFIAVSMLVSAFAIHRLASHRLRRAPTWDCGTPDPSPATQYTGASLAQPIRRVFGAFAFAAREEITMPPPGDVRPARMYVRMVDLVWETFYARTGAVVGFLSHHTNRLQFLTIRKYLSLVFGLLVLLLVALAIWH